MPATILGATTATRWYTATAPSTRKRIAVSSIVVTNVIRNGLEQSGLTGFSFVPVVKEKIVHLDWHLWDQQSPYPTVYPEGGEPGNYIDAGGHSPTTAAELGELWALSIPAIARVERDRTPIESRRKLHLVRTTTHGLDFVRSPDVGYCFVSRRARDWLRTNAGEWIAFEPASER
jgi:hypothetical protein